MNTYKSAGVDIEAGDETVARIKPLAKSTYTPDVLSEIGLFGGFYRIPVERYREPVLVSSVDGVGTKLLVAIAAQRFGTIGEDLVNHCVNDIAVCGAVPLFFLDYLATGKLMPEAAESIVAGFARACQANGCALIGGETAEMPGLYREGHFDISGTIVGIAERGRLLKGEGITEGDVIVGFNSTGLHTNGYSLARSVLLPRFTLEGTPEGLTETLADALLKPHRSYLALIQQLAATGMVKGFAHITGGGIAGNTRRIIPEGLEVRLDSSAWSVPPLFTLIAETGGIPEEEMLRVFNMGIGLTAVCAPGLANAVATAAGEPCRIIGCIEKAR